MQIMLIINPNSPCPDTIIQPLETNTALQPALFIPNVFTPNNDGKNDRFEISLSQPCPNVEITIYNRWGQEVFHSKAQNNGWDGTFNGIPAPEGVYFYSVRFNKKLKNGYVSLVR